VDPSIEMLHQVAAALRYAERVVAITGAGISAESGIPTFRGSSGLWRAFRPEDLATPEAFARDPALVWEWYRWRRGLIATAKPNLGHLVLARFETRFPGFMLLTQNVDGLHRQAGSRRLIELHGNIWRARCTAEPERVLDESPAPGAVRSVAGPSSTGDGGLPRCQCGALLRPDVVWFGVALRATDIERAGECARSCEVLLVIGTSAVVYPVAALPAMARRAGARVVEVNVEDTPLTHEADFVLRGPSGSILPALERLL
jgi:NAD-dependent deacetylase